MSSFCRATSVSFLMPRLAATIAAAVAVAAVGVLPAQAMNGDVQAPVILSAAVTPGVIDVVDGPVEVTVRVEAEDRGSGIKPDSFLVSPEADKGLSPVKPKVMTLVSGDHYRGIYEATFTFPELIWNGDWTFSAVIRDNAGNGNYDYNGNATLGVLQRPTPVRSSPDTEAPIVTASHNATLVDVTDGPATIELTAEAHDSGIGFQAGSIAYYSSLRDYLIDISADQKVARFKRNIIISKYTDIHDPRGTYLPYFDSVNDANGNASSRVPAGKFTVGTRPLRAKSPRVIAEGGNLKSSWAAHADPLGVLEYEVQLKSSSVAKTVKTTALEVTHTELAAGTYTAQVRARNQLGWGEWTTPSTPVEYTPAPMESSTPTVSGTPKVGQTLTANPGTWTSGASLAYRWFASGAAVSGATGSTLVLGPSHVGKAITVRVTGSKPGHVSVSKTSAATAPVAKGTLAGTTPTITGTARIGSILTVNPGTWSPAAVALTYQWYRSEVAVTGATAPSYQLTAADLGKTITVTATGRKTGYNVASRTSRATAPVAANVLTAPRPIIPRTAAVGRTLTADTGTWSPAGVTLTYQWKRNGSPIPGATAISYRAVSADRGSALSITVTGRKSGYPVKTATSNSTSAVTG